MAHVSDMLKEMGKTKSPETEEARARRLQDVMERAAKAKAEVYARTEAYQDKAPNILLMQKETGKLLVAEVDLEGRTALILGMLNRLEISPDYGLRVQAYNNDGPWFYAASYRLLPFVPKDDSGVAQVIRDLWRLDNEGEAETP